MRRRTLPMLLIVALLVGGACGDDGGDPDDAAAASDAAAEDESGEADGTSEATDAPGQGVAVIDGERVVLQPARCNLDEVEMAAGAGTQALDLDVAGTSESGVEVMIAARGHAEGGMFAEEIVHVTFIGDRDDGINSLLGTFEGGQLVVDGSIVRVTDLPLADPVSGTELLVSFEARC